MITKFKLYENYDSIEIVEGDVVYCEGMVGLVISKEYLDSDNHRGFDVYFRSMMGEINFIWKEDMEKCDDEHITNNLWSYVSIANKNDFLINIPYEYAEDYPEEYKNMELRKKIDEYDI